MKTEKFKTILLRRSAIPHCHRRKASATVIMLIESTKSIGSDPWVLMVSRGDCPQALV